ncbi:hypothetical protein JCM5350_005893 [Sporobolomyces pararoseus]
MTTFNSPHHHSLQSDIIIIKADPLLQIVEAIGQSWDHRHTGGNKKLELNLYGQKTLEKWCTDTKKYLDEELLPSLGLPLESDDSRFILLEPAYSIVSGLFHIVERNTGPFGTYNSPSKLPILHDAFKKHLSKSQRTYHIVSVELWSTMIDLLHEELVNESDSTSIEQNYELMKEIIERSKKVGLFSILTGLDSALVEKWESLKEDDQRRLYSETRLLSERMRKNGTVEQFYEILLENKNFAAPETSNSGNSSRSKPAMFLKTFGLLLNMSSSRSPRLSNHIQASANSPFGFPLAATRPPGTLDYSLPSMTSRKRALYRMAPSL